MRYENISKLVCQVGRSFEKQGYISRAEDCAHPLTVALQVLLGVRLGRIGSTERRLPRQLYRLFRPYQRCPVSLWKRGSKLATGGSCALEPF